MLFSKNEKKSLPQHWIALQPGGAHAPSEERMCIGNRLALASQDMPDAFMSKIFTSNSYLDTSQD